MVLSRVKPEIATRTSKNIIKSKCVDSSSSCSPGLSNSDYQFSSAELRACIYSMLWTGTDIFMAFLLGPILRNVSLSTRKEIVYWLMPKMVFYMPTVAAVTTTAGYFLASRLGLITLFSPYVYWLIAVLIIVIAMLVQGLGILLPTNLCVYFEAKES